MPKPVKPDREPLDFVYTTVKVDREVMKRVRAVAALQGMDVQEFVSLHLNRIASEALDLDPIRFKKELP